MHPSLLAALLPLACGDGADSGDPLAGLQIVTDDPTDAPVEGLDDDWLDRFFEGDVYFEQPFRESDGLGPNYIRQSCASCHADDARGPGVVTKFILVSDDGVTAHPDQSALPWGFTARPQVAGGATTPLEVPQDLPGLLITTRAAPATFGRGYLEAIADSEIERVEAEQAARGDAITGRINRVPWQSQANPESPFHAHQPGDQGLVGRFGLKARISTLDEFAADAFQGDMSITSPLRPDELPNPDGLGDDLLEGADIDLEIVNLVADYVRLLAIPRRDLPAGDGPDLFVQADCAACHVPSLRTRDDYPIPPLAGIDAPVYTDMLLHDMGIDAADGLEDFQAGSTQWQTPPLIGLRHLRSYMHDGGAFTVRDAILAHQSEGSEANDSVAAFLALPDDQQDALVAWVEAL